MTASTANGSGRRSSLAWLRTSSARYGAVVAVGSVGAILGSWCAGYPVGNASSTTTPCLS
jgi:hypothetical protein